VRCERTNLAVRQRRTLRNNDLAVLSADALVVMKAS